MTSLTVILSQKEPKWKITSENIPKMASSDTVHTKPQASVSAPVSIPPFSYINTIKEKKINQCTFCPKKFTKPSALKAHLFSHTGEKPHSCPHTDCNRHFSLLSNLRRHIKIHAPASLKKKQQQQQQRRASSMGNHPPPPLPPPPPSTHSTAVVATTANKRRVQTLLPSPYTSSTKIFPVPSILSSVQIPLHHPKPVLPSPLPPISEKR